VFGVTPFEIAELIASHAISVNEKTMTYEHSGTHTLSTIDARTRFIQGLFGEPFPQEIPADLKYFSPNASR
jgi:hypothetical protein